MSNKIKKDKTPKRILMVGQSGLEKSKYLEELQTILERQGYSLSFDTIGHKMIEIYNRHGGSVTEDTILNLERFIRAFREASMERNNRIYGQCKYRFLCNKYSCSLSLGSWTDSSH